MFVLLALLALWPQPVRERLEWPSVDHAPAKYQPRDLTTVRSGPYRVFVGENGYYCAVSDAAFVQHVEGDLFDCRWQPPRQG